MYDFDYMKNIDINDVDIESLVDINDISVDKTLPKDKRIAEYIRQIKNPYCYRCGKFIVKASFSDNGLSMEDCLRSILL